MAPPHQRKFSFRKDSTFSTEESTFIILKYGEVKNYTDVRRAFRNKFLPRNPGKAPHLQAFKRVIDHFLQTASVRPQVPVGKSPLAPEEIEAVKTFLAANPKAHIRSMVEALGMSFGKIWTILRKKLKLKPYKPHLTQVLTPLNMEARLAACSFWLTFTEEQFERIIWSDEKWFVLHQSPNRKNDVFWGPEGTENVVACKKAHGAKVMTWAGMVDKRVLPIHWFEGSVDSAAYLAMLQGLVWPAVRASATRKQYWFQQDGASVHCTKEVLAFLASKFGARVISRNSEHNWPPYSPDLSPLDFSFWGQAMAHVVRCQPATIPELKQVVEDFASNFDADTARRMARHTRYRAELCVSQAGGHFEHLVKKRN